MAESKRTFHAGKMNRDLDDRLVPNGEYRDALNVNIGRSEGSSVGAVENLKGNERIHNNLTVEFVAMDGQMFFDLPDDATGVFSVTVNGEVLPTDQWSFGQVGVTLAEGLVEADSVVIIYDNHPDGLTIGTTVDPNNDRFYWFQAFQDINAIYEYDLNTGVTSTILTDRETREAPLPTCAPEVTGEITGTNDSLGIRPDFPNFPTFPTAGCLDTSASNTDLDADYHDQSICRYDVIGCGDPTALNYNAAVTVDDRSLCQYPLNNFTFEAGGFTCTVNSGGIATVSWDDTTFPDLMFTYTVEGESGDQDNLTQDIGQSVGQDRPVRFQFSITVPDQDGSGRDYDNAGETLDGGDAECYSLQEGTTAPPPGEFSLEIVGGTAPANTSLTGNGVAVGQMDAEVATNFTFIIHENPNNGFTQVPILTFQRQSGTGGAIVTQTTPTAQSSYVVTVSRVEIGTTNTVWAPVWDTDPGNTGTGATTLFGSGDLDITCSIDIDGNVSVTEANGVNITWSLQQVDNTGASIGSAMTGSPTSIPANTGEDGLFWRVDVTATVPSGHPNSPGSPTASLYDTSVITSCSTEQPGTRPSEYTTTVTTQNPGANVQFVGTFTSTPAIAGTVETTNTLFEVTPDIGYAFTGTPTARIVNTTDGQQPDDISRVSFDASTGILSQVTIGTTNETYEVRWADTAAEMNIVTVTVVLEQPENGVLTWSGLERYQGAPGSTISISEMLATMANEGFIRSNPSILGGDTFLANGEAIPSLFQDFTGGTIFQTGGFLASNAINRLTFPAEDTTVVFSTGNLYAARTPGRVYRISSDGVNFGVRQDGSVIAATTMVLYDPPVDPVMSAFNFNFGISGFGNDGDASSFALIAVNRNPVVWEVCSTTRPRLQDPSGGFGSNNARATASYTITGPHEICYSDSLNGGTSRRASGGEELPTGL